MRRAKFILYNLLVVGLNAKLWTYHARLWTSHGKLKVTPSTVLILRN